MRFAYLKTTNKIDVSVFKRRRFLTKFATFEPWTFQTFLKEVWFFFKKANQKKWQGAILCHTPVSKMHFFCVGCCFQIFVLSKNQPPTKKIFKTFFCFETWRQILEQKIHLIANSSQLFWCNNGYFLSPNLFRQEVCPQILFRQVSKLDVKFWNKKYPIVNSSHMFWWSNGYFLSQNLFKCGLCELLARLFWDKKIGLYLGCFVLFFLKNSELYLGCFVLFWYFFSKEISQKSAAFKGKPQKFLHFLTQKIGSIPGVYCPAEDRTIQTDTYRILSRFSTFLKRILSKSWIFF